MQDSHYITATMTSPNVLTLESSIRLFISMIGILLFIVNIMLSDMERPKLSPRLVSSVTTSTFPYSVGKEFVNKFYRSLVAL